ncbi:hypothetical protein DPMN_145302 [Dreissena polymorpha]|uniref:Uncharacterized protein n=1 Tax=Dreissena polymorpha TaxID=45954 RepID=A0A9D4J172_DREPO|nr:hypothetical protein DPMN_145302 [Dreissena polymorpha]
MLLEQQIAARAASRCCTSSNLLLEQHFNAARAAFFSAAAEVKVSTLLVRHSREQRNTLSLQSPTIDKAVTVANVSKIDHRNLCLLKIATYP